jgi:putative nucleotidyltransferase with HDIG domain
LIDITEQLPQGGYWEVRIGGRVAAQGASAAQAAAAVTAVSAADRRFHYVETAVGSRLALAPLLDELRPHLSGLPYPVYLVGGAVRDALLGTPSHDLDFVVPEKGIKSAFALANALNVPAYVLDKERDTGRVVLGEDLYLDFARFRGADLAADLRARDFTINALALPATAVHAASVIDVCGGLADLQARCLQLTHAASLQTDPVRGLRALRLAHKLRFSPSAETAAAIRALPALLSVVSPERLRDELLKMAGLPAAAAAFADLDRYDLLAAALPPLAALRGVTQSPPHHEDVWAHILSVLHNVAELDAQLHAGDDLPAVLAPYREPLADHLARAFAGGLDGRLVLRLGALFHDVGKAETRTVEESGRIRFYNHDKVGAKIAAQTLRELALSKQVVGYVEQIVAGHMRPLLLAGNPQLSRRAIYRFFRATGEAGIDILLLALADHLATYRGTGPAEVWARVQGVIGACLEHFYTRHEETVAPPPLVDGRTLMDACDIPPGRKSDASST